MQLYKQYCEGMTIVAHRYVKDRALAEDAMQEAFIKAFSKLHQYKAEVTFGAWLKRIVINKSIDLLKSKKQQLLELNEVYLKVVDQEVDDNWLVEDTITIETVKTAIEQLPEKYWNQFLKETKLMDKLRNEESKEVL